MTPPSPAESTVASAPRGYGVRLRDAREAAGLTTDQVAQQLKLAPRQVEALEKEDLTHLPEVTYVRGFVRNYARLLKLDADRVLDDVPLPHEEPAQSTTFRRAGGRMTELPSESVHRLGWARWAIPLLLVAVIAGFAGYEWLRQQRARATAAQAVQAPVAPAREPTSGGAPGQTLPVTPTVVGDGAATGATGAAGPPAAASVDAARETRPTDSAASGALAHGSTSAASPPAPASSGAPGAAPEVRLQFAETAWVEIKDGRGRVIHSQTNPAGSTRVVTGDPPLELVVGNAANVRVTYNGEQVDLAPHTRASVARVTLR